LKKDNIYLKGGSSIAEALRADNKNNNAGSNSITMRMKRNREAIVKSVME